MLGAPVVTRPASSIDSTLLQPSNMLLHVSARTVPRTSTFLNLPRSLYHGGTPGQAVSSPTSPNAGAITSVSSCICHQHDPYMLDPSGRG